MMELDSRVEARIHRSLPEDYSDSNGFIPWIVEAKKTLHIPEGPITDDDACAIGSLVADQFVSMVESDETNQITVENRRTDPWVDTLCRKIESQVGVGREAMNRSVDALDISPDAKYYIWGILDETTCVFNEKYSSHGYAHHDEKTGTNSIVLSFPLEIIAARGTAKYFQQDSWDEMLKGLTTHIVGHELGHIIDMNIGRPSGFLAAEYMADYPARYNFGDASFNEFISERVSGERFAESFGQDIFMGLGFRSTILVDHLRVMATFLHGNGITVDDYQRINSFTNRWLRSPDKQYDENERDKAISDSLDYLDLLFFDSVLYELFPHSRDVVSTMVRAGWEKMNK